MSLKIIPTKLKDVKIVETDVFGDNRGFFTETWTRDKFHAAGITTDFNQDNQSLSAEPGVLRGMHYQGPLCTDQAGPCGDRRR